MKPHNISMRPRQRRFTEKLRSKDNKICILFSGLFHGIYHVYVQSLDKYNSSGKSAILLEVLFSRDKKFSAKEFFMIEVSLLANLSESHCHTTCATFLSLL